jgi:hypothetical protein
VAEWLPWLGGTLTAIAAVLGAYAAIKARSTEARTATREETQQALDAQDRLLDRYEAKIIELERRVDRCEVVADRALAGRNEARLMHRECERRLKIAEARIAELER